MKTNITLVAIACGALVVFSAERAAAVSYTLSFDPTSQVVGLGGSAFVDVVATESGGPGALGSIDLDVAFDPSIVSFVGATGGSGFGISTGLIAVPVGPGVENIFEVSFMLPADLVLLQPDAFVVGTLEFSAIGLGTSPLTFGLIGAGDEGGFDITGSVDDTMTGSITVRAPGVPDGGSTAALLALPALILLGRACRRTV